MAFLGHFRFSRITSGTLSSWWPLPFYWYYLHPAFLWWKIDFRLIDVWYIEPGFKSLRLCNNWNCLHFIFLSCTFWRLEWFDLKGLTSLYLVDYISFKDIGNLLRNYNLLKKLIWTDARDKIFNETIVVIKDWVWQGGCVGITYGRGFSLLSFVLLQSPLLLEDPLVDGVLYAGDQGTGGGHLVHGGVMWQLVSCLKDSITVDTRVSFTRRQGVFIIGWFTSKRDDWHCAITAGVSVRRREVSFLCDLNLNRTPRLLISILFVTGNNSHKSSPSVSEDASHSW